MKLCIQLVQVPEYRLFLGLEQKRLLVYFRALSGSCFIITGHEKNNRFLVSMQINVLAKPSFVVVCRRFSVLDITSGAWA